MHPAAERGFRDNLNAIRQHTQTTLEVRRVLDMGGQDVNGTVHDLLQTWFPGVTIDVLDIEAGRGVTIVGDAREWQTWWSGDLYDMVISTEMLEHLEHWHRAVESAYRVLKPGGWFIGTCASLGRAPHGATGAPEPAPGEWYANVALEDFYEAAGVYFPRMNVQYDVNPDEWTTHDLYWRGQR